MVKEIFKFSIRRLIQTKINGGIVLLFVALAAMIIANSPLQEYYNILFSQNITLTIGSFNLFDRHDGNPMTLLDFINDALMAIFFFSVGLEIKRELLVGELSSPRKALLPVVAACGGMIVPVLLFYLISQPGLVMRGAAIPMATDIAFSLGVLSLLGKKVPLSLKIFLTAFAVVDDIGGIIVIALFYSSHLTVEYLIAAMIIVALLYIGGRQGIHNKFFFISFGIIVWCLFINAGIHPTIAGVIVAFTVPARPKLHIYKYVNSIRESLKRLPENSNEIILSNSELSILKSIESASDKVVSPLQAMDDDLRTLVNYVVMPLFAFANASISFEGFTLASLEGVSVTIFRFPCTRKTHRHLLVHLPLYKMRLVNHARQNGYALPFRSIFIRRDRIHRVPIHCNSFLCGNGYGRSHVIEPSKNRYHWRLSVCWTLRLLLLEIRLE